MWLLHLPKWPVWHALWPAASTKCLVVSHITQWIFGLMRKSVNSVSWSIQTLRKFRTSDRKNLYFPSCMHEWMKLRREFKIYISCYWFSINSFYFKNFTNTILLLCAFPNFYSNYVSELHFLSDTVFQISICCWNFHGTNPRSIIKKNSWI